MQTTWSENCYPWKLSTTWLEGWVNEIFPTDVAKHLDTRDLECDYDTDSDVEHSLECNEDDFD